jgi:hypothetical protein
LGHVPLPHHWVNIDTLIFKIYFSVLVYYVFVKAGVFIPLRITFHLLN